MVAVTDVIEAPEGTYREVGYTVALMPWPRRWRKVLDHLAAKHPETTPTGDRNAVANPHRLDAWHREDHADTDAWIWRGQPPLHPHRHLSLAARIREMWEWR